MRRTLQRPELRWALGLALLGIAERAALWRLYAPASFGDTPSYMRLAAALADSGLGGYDGTRVPGYPLFLALLGRDPGTIGPAQMVLGWGLSMLLFSIGWKTTGSLRFGFLVGMLYNLLPGAILFEANLLSETLTAFTVVLSLALLVALDRFSGDLQPARAGAGDPQRLGSGRSAAPRLQPFSRRDPSVAPRSALAKERSGAPGLHFFSSPSSLALELTLALLLGLAAALAGMVRPLFFLLPPWLLLFVWFGRPPALRRRLARGLAFSLGPILILGGWLSWVYRTYQMISPTTMGGYHLVQHTGEYFEYLPDDAAPIRDTYLKYRDAQIAERGNQTNAIWDAIPEMSQASGLSFFGLSAELQRLSMQLIQEHPLLYLQNVAEGWIDFWKAPVYWDRAGLRVPGLTPLFTAWIFAGRAIPLLANAAFLLGSAAAALSPKLRSRLGWDRFALAAGGLIWLSSIVQTLVDHGDNPRFLVPLQAILILLVLRAARAWRGWVPKAASS